MQTLEDFRIDFLNDIKYRAEDENIYATNVFITTVLDRVSESLGIKPQIEFCYIKRDKKGPFASMQLDAASIDETLFEINLFLADFNPEDKKTLGQQDIVNYVKRLCNFFTNVLNGAFSEDVGSPEERIAVEIREKIELVERLHLFIFSTNQLSNRTKIFDLPKIKIPNNERTLDLKLEIIDIERLYSIANESEELQISPKDFGCQPIKCLRADIQTDRYETYLAVVPGAFLAKIYKEHGGKLLKANVRAFLNMTGDVNKGIRETIKANPENFFAYNNGISTTAKDVQFEIQDGSLVITSFVGLQIVNGGQTTASLAYVMIKDKAPLDKVYVQMKMTLIKGENKEIIRDIAKYTNSQTKVTATDLNSSHEYYVRLETFSRRIFAPLKPNELRPTKWFFERTKKQYNQPTLTQKKSEQKRYEELYPKKQKFTIEDVAKYISMDELRPYDVAWGAQENAKRFHKLIEKKWDESPAFCDEKYYKSLVGKVLLYTFIRKHIIKTEWYKNKTGNLAQIVTYTFSKFSYEAKRHSKQLNYLAFWQAQSVPNSYANDVERMAHQIFDYFYDPNSNITDVREFCKRSHCWDAVKALPFHFSPEVLSSLELIEEEPLYIESNESFFLQEPTSSLEKRNEDFLIKESYEAYLNKTLAKNSGAIHSYLIAFELLSVVLATRTHLLGEEKSLWQIHDVNQLTTIRQFVLDEAKKESGGIFEGADLKSYLAGGFCSATISKFIDFLNAKD